MDTQRLARITGAVYLILAVLAFYSTIVTESVAVPGDAAATAGNIVDSQWLFGTSLVSWIGVVVADIALSVTFYLLLRPINRTLSLFAATLRLAFAGMLGAILLNLYDAYLLLADADRAAALAEADAQVMASSGWTASAPGSSWRSYTSAST